MMVFNRNLLFQGCIFRCQTVSFRENTWVATCRSLATRTRRRRSSNSARGLMAAPPQVRFPRMRRPKLVFQRNRIEWLDFIFVKSSHQKFSEKKTKLGGGNSFFLFSSLPGEDFQFLLIFFKGVVQPPTRKHSWFLLVKYEWFSYQVFVVLGPFQPGKLNFEMIFFHQKKKLHQILFFIEEAID